jgi:hypothetical protein
MLGSGKTSAQQVVQLVGRWLPEYKFVGDVAQQVGQLVRIMVWPLQTAHFSRAARYVKAQLRIESFAHFIILQ